MLVENGIPTRKVFGVVEAQPEDESEGKDGTQRGKGIPSTYKAPLFPHYCSILAHFWSLYSLKGHFSGVRIHFEENLVGCLRHLWFPTCIYRISQYFYNEKCPLNSLTNRSYLVHYT